MAKKKSKKEHTERTTRQEMEASLRGLPQNVKDYWVREALRQRYHRKAADWIMRGIPELHTYMAGYNKRVAFVLANGPSLARVKADEWKALANFFTCGVNKTAKWLQDERGLFNLPALNFFCDHIPKGGWKGEAADFFRKAFGACEGKLLVDERADMLNPDWITLVFGMAPQWAPELGISITGSVTKDPWLRATAACTHLIGMFAARFEDIPIEEIYLLGADHGKEYYKNEPEKANEGYAALASFLSEKGIGLGNCGMESSVESLAYVPLKKVLEKYT